MPLRYENKHTEKCCFVPKTKALGSFETSVTTWRNITEALNLYLTQKQRLSKLLLRPYEENEQVASKRGQNKGRFTHGMPFPCRSPAMPCR